MRVPRPQVDLVATPQFSGVGEPAQVRGEGLEPGKSYRLHWTRVIGNRMTGAGWEQSSTSVAESKADGSGRAEFRFIVCGTLISALGKLIANTVPFAPVASGSGSRHMAFHPDRQHAYVLSELASSVTVFNY